MSVFSSIKLLFVKDKKFIADIKSITGLYPGNISLYKLAITHRSASKKSSSGEKINNERLEFLGDAILDSVIAEYLYIKFQNKDEGFLTKLRSKIVNREFINELAFKINLEQLIISNTIKNGNTLIYGDAFEALIGAVYLDKGYKKVKKFIIKKVLIPHVNLNELSITETNYKSLLIEWGQKNKENIEFRTSEYVDGDEYSFQSAVIIDEVLRGKGFGDSKKTAEKAAAEEVMRKMKEEK